MLSTQHAVATKQLSNKKRLEYENISIKTGKIPLLQEPCFVVSQVWESFDPKATQTTPKQNLDLLQDDVCQSGSCLRYSEAAKSS